MKETSEPRGRMSAGPIFASASSDPLLAAPPERANCNNNSRTGGQKVAPSHHRPMGLFGSPPSKRWYYKALRNEERVRWRRFSRKIRSDQGQHPAVSPKLAELLPTQYRQHPSWSYQLHSDNLAVLVEKDPALGPAPSYASVLRYMKDHGLFKRPRRGPVHSPGAQAAEHRYEAARSAATKASMSTPSGTWIFITAPCACCSTNGQWVYPLLLGDPRMIVPASAAMPNGIWPKEPRNSATALARLFKSAPCPEPS